jgi:hypothetical protein
VRLGNKMGPSPYSSPAPTPVPTAVSNLGVYVRARLSDLRLGFVLKVDMDMNPNLDAQLRHCLLHCNVVALLSCNCGVLGT